MITKEIAMSAHNRQVFYHVTVRNRDGTAARCRINGRCKTWVKQPGNFRLPVKHGLKDCFYITPDNAHEWLTSDPTEKETT